MKNVGKFSAAVMAVCLGAGSAQATANDNAGTVTLSTPTTIVQVSTSDTTWSKFWMNGPLCGPSALEFSISKSHPAHSQMYQTVLAAFLAGKPINMRWEIAPNGLTCWVKAITIVKDP